MAIIEREVGREWREVKRLAELGKAFYWVGHERRVDGGMYRITFGGRQWIAGSTAVLD